MCAHHSKILFHCPKHHLAECLSVSLKDSYMFLFFYRRFKLREEFTTLFEEISPEALKKCLQKPFIYQQESNGNSVTICALAAIIKLKIVIFVLNYITVWVRGSVNFPPPLATCTSVNNSYLFIILTFSARLTCSFLCSSTHLLRTSNKFWLFGAIWYQLNLSITLFSIY